MSKSWHLDRRTFLRGTGAALALPWLESMSLASPGTQAELPRRFAAVYFPFGVSMAPDDHEHRDWGWFPKGDGADFEFTKVLQPLAEYRQDVTVLGGLSHPNGRRMGGHDTGDTFLTAVQLEGSDYRNAVSLDQLAAREIGRATRFPSLVLSSDGGVGEPTRSTTLSFSATGRPVPALADPKQIFDRLFGDGDESTEAQRRRLRATGSMLDRVLEHSRSLERRLGKRDRAKLDEYLASVRDVEQRVERSQRWLDVAKPEVDPASLPLEATPKAPEDYLRAMYDLMFLAFQTDTTRLATYMIGQVAGATTIANAFPACIGLSGNWHGLAHGQGKKNGYENLGRFDQFLAKHFAYFVGRLAATEEGDGTLLDRTVLLYGSSNSRTHQNRNYPLVLAGGRGLGLKHGQFRRFEEKTPLSNLYVTILQRLGVERESFVDSTGEMSEVVA